MNIKHYHRVVTPWLKKINVSASSDKKALLISDECPSHLNIDLLKELGVYVMVVLIRITNTSHETNMEDMATFGTVNT